MDIYAIKNNKNKYFKLYMLRNSCIFIFTFLLCKIFEPYRISEITCGH